jgi:hypothetical protein
MLNQILSLMVILSLSSTFAVHAVCGQTAKTPDHAVAKIKRDITKLGVDALVSVKLSDGSKQRGRIAEIDDDSLVLLTAVAGDRTRKLTNPITIANSEIRQIKHAGSSSPAGGANLGPAFLILGAILLIKLIR